LIFTQNRLSRGTDKDLIRLPSRAALEWNSQIQVLSSLDMGDENKLRIQILFSDG
jgi:hypothetical protein